MSTSMATFRRTPGHFHISVLDFHRVCIQEKSQRNGDKDFGSWAIVL